MKIEKTFLHSKLARRIFWLFVLCALIPITVLAVISLRDVTAQLREQSLRELRRASREEAMSIYERLSFLEANLRLEAVKARGGMATSVMGSSEAEKESRNSLEQRFTGIEVVRPNGEWRAIFGKTDGVTYTAEQQRILKSGMSVLSTVACGDEPCISLSEAVNAEDPSAGIIVGEIRSKFLWDPETLMRPMTVCVLDELGARLFCSGEGPEHFPAVATNKFSGEFEWTGNGKENLASYWNLPLKTSFGVSHWTVISSEGKPDMVAPLLRFRFSFILVFLLSVWVVLLLSLVQIRRNLVPLAKLKEGTRGISAGNFRTRVAIKSGDEFEELAGSFNSMAGRIEKQIKAQQLVNEVDRAILSAWDMNRIVGTVCSRMRELIPNDLVSVNLFDKKSSPQMISQIYSAGSENPKETQTIELTAEEVAAVWNRREVAVVNGDEAKAIYLQPLAAKGMRSFLVVPVLAEKGTSAIFVLGHGDSAAVWSEEEKRQARHLADQIAVGFANSHLLAEVEEVQWSTLTALARAIDANSPWTLGHSERVTAGAIRIGQAMGLPARELDIMRRGGLVHDIGKIGTPREILDKPGKLSREEMQIMREHVNTGVRILQPLSGLAESMSIVAQHHEWVNGGGYPNGLTAKDITLHARIFAVSDCFDALISDRPYRAGMPVEKVMEILEEGRGKQFDPEVLDLFQNLMEQERTAKAEESLARIG